MNSPSASARTLRIVIAEDNADLRNLYTKLLPIMGYEVVGAAADGAELVRLCLENPPDLVIADIAMPMLDGIEATAIIFKRNPVPVVLVSAHYDKGFEHRTQIEHAMVYLVKPVSDRELRVAIETALVRFDQFQLIASQTYNVRQALKDRKVVEQAKNRMMHSTGRSEADVFGYLLEMARQQDVPLVKAAQRIIAASLL